MANTATLAAAITALTNAMIEKPPLGKGWPAEYQKSIRFHFYNSNKNETRFELGVSSFGTMKASIDMYLDMNKVLSEPDATVDTPFCMWPEGDRHLLHMHVSAVHPLPLLQALPWLSSPH